MPPPASIDIFAIAAHADERDAHIREAGRFGRTLPEGSYGRRNRQAIAARGTRIAARLCAVQHAYRTAIEREPTAACPSSKHAPDHEIELELSEESIYQGFGGKHAFAFLMPSHLGRHFFFSPFSSHSSVDASPITTIAKTIADAAGCCCPIMTARTFSPARRAVHPRVILLARDDPVWSLIFWFRFRSAILDLV
jgi:hypothetical protein